MSLLQKVLRSAMYLLLAILSLQSFVSARAAMHVGGAQEMRARQVAVQSSAKEEDDDDDEEGEDDDDDDDK
jgi:hypothetical protein